MKRVIASSVPQVAVFWYIPELNKFIGDQDDWENAVYFGDFGQVDSDHFDRWESYRKEYKLPDVEYDYYPRGRVMFNSRIHKYVVVCDACIASDPELRNELCSAYNLPSEKVVWDTDEHYTCFQCDER